MHDNSSKDSEEDYLTKKKVIMNRMEHDFDGENRKKHQDKDNKTK